jgi:preprotein translocase subunit SecD
MNDRTPYWLVIIALLTGLAVYVNIDLAKPDFEPASGFKRFLSWQGENVDQRSLKLREGLDLQGGLQVLLQADQSQGQLAAGDLDAAALVITNRVDALGVVEPLVQTQGDDKIVVELPGVEDPELAVRTIGETALLEFVHAAQETLIDGDEVATSYPDLFGDLPEDKQKPFLGDPNDPLGTGRSATGSDAITETAGITETGAITATGSTTDTARTPAAAAASDPVTPTIETIYPTIFTGKDVDDASVGFDPMSGVVVNFQLSTEGGQRMQQYSSSHVGDFMPILLDKKVLSAPSIRDTIVGTGQITGQFSQAEAQSLVAQINSGSLPVPLKVVGQTLVGPTLGGEAVQAAIRGGVIGLLAVMIFMLFYYRMPGLIANVALILYALFTLTIFRMFGVTLTLAGIAGFVLSVGMAVDANILIFERMKEELRGGRRIGAAMDIGFSRAWPSIRDSNVSTLITCMVLLWFGSQFGASVVKGFAVTLAIGVLVSMFTAIVVTRNFLKVANRAVLHESDKPTLEDSRLRSLFGF